MAKKKKKGRVNKALPGPQKDKMLRSASNMKGEPRPKN